MCNIVALIPARGGSKKVPRKNIRLLAGLPLIAYSIRTAMESKMITKIIVSTDDAEIAEVARAYGAEVPFIRPIELAQDNTADLPVFIHALEWLKNNEECIPEMLVHLRPTAPLRQGYEIDRAIQCLANDAEADSLRSVCIPGQNPYKMWVNRQGYLVPLIEIKEWEKRELYNQPRQSLPDVLWQNASIDIIRTRTITQMNSMTGRKIIPFLMEESESIDLDTESDFFIAEQIIQEKKTNCVKTNSPS